MVKEFEYALKTMLARNGMGVSNLAERTGYNPLFLKSVTSGKNRQIPVDFFVRIADALDLTDEAKDALVRS